MNGFSDVPEVYPIGSRVVINGHFEWPDGTQGTIASFPTAVRSLRSDGGDEAGTDWLYHTFNTTKGPLNAQWVEFDEPTDDGSGDGPYRAGEVDVGCLRRLDSDAGS